MRRAQRPRSFAMMALVLASTDCRGRSRMSRFRAIALITTIAVAATVLAPSLARADETVSIGSSKAVLLQPVAPRASVILMPGGGGAIGAGPNGQITGLTGNQLVRTR